MMGIVLRILCLTGLAVTATAVAAEPPALEKNPFSRPPSQRTILDQVGDDNGDGTSLDLVLMATMVAANERLANVGGRIVRPGDEVLGHKLLHVFEDRAVFARNGKRLTIHVKPELVEENE